MNVKPVQKVVQKEDAMWLQKEMINQNYHEVASAHAAGRKVSATFVPGNLNELLMCFDFARRLPETDALQNGMRKKSGKMIMDAERVEVCGLLQRHGQGEALQHGSRGEHDHERIAGARQRDVRDHRVRH